MREENGTIRGDLLLTEDLRLTGQITESCTVPSGLHLDLHGLIGGDLQVDAGGTAEIFGTVGGNLVADGMVTLFGTVNGVVSGEGLQVREGAIVRGDL
jgi:cytoskeletal protein CcmA (bactofilin family)